MISVTKYSLLTPAGLLSEHEAVLEEHPSHAAVREIVEPHLQGRMERVRVRDPILGDADMFVDEMAHLKQLPRNEMATKLYRERYLAEQPDADPRRLPHIAGNAVVFHRPIFED